MSCCASARLAPQSAGLGSPARSSRNFSHIEPGLGWKARTDNREIEAIRNKQGDLGDSGDLPGQPAESGTERGENDSFRGPAENVPQVPLSSTLALQAA